MIRPSWDSRDRFYEKLIDSVVSYPKSRHDDIMDAATYAQKWLTKPIAENGNLVDLDNLLVWNHKQSEPIAKITSCEMVGGPGSRASLRVEAIALTKEEKEKMVKYNKCSGPSRFGIKRVIFSDPATIVFWEDGTKTVVKAHNEDFDPEKGLAMAVCKRVYGDKYHRVFKDNIPKEEPVDEDTKTIIEAATEAFRTLNRQLNAGKENK